MSKILAPWNASRELEFTDAADRALYDAAAVVHTVIDALGDDREQHRNRLTLTIAEDRLDTLRELMDEWGAKSRTPRAIAESAARDAASAAEASKPFDPALRATLKKMLRTDAAKRRKAKGKTKRTGRKGGAK